jgi:N-(2-amino-2-carboxyethyl)-L-glutamate synthase
VRLPARGGTGTVGDAKGRRDRMTHKSLVSRLEFVSGSLPETPVVRLAHDKLDLYAKLEFSNPNGTAKDRSAYWILKKAIELGEITAGSTVVESSSGNFALALASFCRALGVSFVPVLDPNVNAPTEAFLRMACDRVEKVDELDPTGGFLRTRLARVQQLRSELNSAYWPDQYSNPNAMLAHYELTGDELCRAFHHIDYLFVGVGTGATIAGLSARVRQSFPKVRVVAVDAEGSIISGGPPRRRFIPGIGSSIMPPMMQDAVIDDTAIVPEWDAVSGCHQLLRRHGLFVGGSTGSVYAAISSYFADYRGPRPTVVFLCADRGNAYSDTVYNPVWVEQTIGAENAYSHGLLTTPIMPTATKWGRRECPA